MTEITRRHFYRCTGCLEVVALPDRLDMTYSRTIATCENCDQPFDYMGRVSMDATRLQKDRLECKCDGRCTDARGPLCVCKCGGKNHGAGMAGYVIVTHDAGSIPRVKLPSTARAKEARRQYDEFAALRAILWTENLALVDRKHGAANGSTRGGYLPESDYRRMRALQDAYRAANAARSHAGRMKILRSVVSLPAPDPIAAVAVAVSQAIDTAPPIADVPFSLSRPIDTRTPKQTTLF